MAKSIMKVSQSKIKLWRKCHRAYFYKYIERLRKKLVSRPFQFGRIAHRMVEAYAEGEDPMDELKKIDLDNKKLFTAEKEMYGEIIRDMGDIMTSYFSYWPKRDLIYLRRNGRSAEHYFEIEISDGIVMIGYIDNIGRTPNKLRWIVERKTFKQRPNEDDRWRNLQSGIYIRANELLGWPSVDGICWDYIHNKPPAVPQALKAGGFSKKRISSLPIVIERFIRENKLKRDDYLPLINTAEQNLSNYFFRVFTPVKRQLVDMMFQEFIDTAREIVDIGETRKDRSIDRHCSWCDYERICRAELMGMDVDFVKEREYEIYKKDKDQETKDDIESRPKKKAGSKKGGGRKKAPAKNRTTRKARG